MVHHFASVLSLSSPENILGGTIEILLHIVKPHLSNTEIDLGAEIVVEEVPRVTSETKNPWQFNLPILAAGDHHLYTALLLVQLFGRLS